MLRKTIIAGVILALAGAAAAGQDGPEPGSVAWVEARIVDARNFEIPEGIRIRWREEQHRLVTDAELDAMRRRTAGKPDHPDRFMLMGEEKRITEGPEVRAFELVYGDATHWRFNETTKPEAGGGFVDMAVNGQDAWQLSPQQAQLLNAGSAPPGYEPSSRVSRFLGLTATFFAGPFAVGPQHDYQVTTDGIAENGRWEARIRRDDGKYGFVLKGEMRGDQLRVMERYSYNLDGEESVLLGITRYAEPTLDPAIARPVYAIAETMLSDGTPGSTRSLTDIGSVAPADLARALRPPSLKGEDMFRGATPTVQLVDLRGSAPIVQEVGADGSIVSQDIAQPDRIEASRVENRFRIVGWVAGALVLVLGLLVWWKRR